MSRTGAGSTFAVVFRARVGAAGVRALRALRKTAKRRFDLRCLDAREEAFGRDPASSHRRDREVGMKLNEILKGYANQQQKFLREQGSRRTDPAKQIIQETITMNEVVKPKLLLDGFQGFEDAVEGADSPANRLIQGQLVKFTNEATWATRGGEELSGTLELVAVNVTRVVQKWGDAQPIETRVLQPGEKFPNLEELNTNVPQSEWREGPDGKLHGPWQAQYLVYLLNPDTAERFTYATGTIGGGIAVRDLVDRVSWMRKFRGEQVYAVISPSTAPMKTRYGTRPRPHFVIKRWVALGGDSALPATEQPALTGPQAVEPPTAKEALDDEIEF